MLLQAFDAVFFQAVTQDGYYLVAGTERRHEGKVNALFYLAVSEYPISIDILTSRKVLSM